MIVENRNGVGSAVFCLRAQLLDITVLIDRKRQGKMINGSEHCYLNSIEYVPYSSEFRTHVRYPLARWPRGHEQCALEIGRKRPTIVVSDRPGSLQASASPSLCGRGFL